ncbi:cytochrome b [Loktanella agnita]|uniref:cytochrome b n=1 Tax=Loktanella agnita TaxID=287097 RepID=UPI0039882349
MTNLSDSPDRFGLISRVFHWGMAALFAAQFTSAAAHWALPRENTLRETLWSFHTDLGITLFVLVVLRGAWGLWNLRNRPAHDGQIGGAAKAGHVVLYGLMVVVPLVRIVAAAGGRRGLSYFGMSIVPARETAIAWTQAVSEWHGELGWTLAAVILGHILFAVVYHRMIQKDGVMERMA